MSKKIEIIQATSPDGNTSLIHVYNDKNPLPSFEIYKLVKSIDAAREFGVADIIDGRKSSLNTREMCSKMLEIIKTNKK